MPAAAATATTSGAEEFDELVARAEAHGAAGEHIAAARGYAAAYRALSEDDRVGLMGEVALDNALVSYQSAHARTPGHLALLEGAVGLLEEHLALRSRLLDAAESDERSSRLSRVLIELNADLDEARLVLASSRPSPRSPSPPPPPLSAPALEPASDQASVPRTGRKGDAAILAVGVTSLACGIALTGGGAWSFREIEWQRRVRQSGLETGTSSEQSRAAFEPELSALALQERREATGLLVAGVALAAAGTGLATWGALRMRRRGRAGGVGLGGVAVSRGAVGLIVTATF